MRPERPLIRKSEMCLNVQDERIAEMISFKTQAADCLTLSEQPDRCCLHRLVTMSTGNPILTIWLDLSSRGFLGNQHRHVDPATGGPVDFALQRAYLARSDRTQRITAAMDFSLTATPICLAIREFHIHACDDLTFRPLALGA